MRALVIAALVIAAVRAAAAEPIVVVVRDGGGEGALAVARLRGQLADLELDVAIRGGALEPTLDAQLATAARIARAAHARAVVWFVPRGGGLAVAVATPGDRRLFVREIPPASRSAVAEAAAVAARGAVRAIAAGGTIGVEVPAALAVGARGGTAADAGGADAGGGAGDAGADAGGGAGDAGADDAGADDAGRDAAGGGAVSARIGAVAPARRRFGLEVALGWQVALDGGADAGAHALAQRTRVHRGAWGASLALTLGPALQRARDGVAIELSRTGAAIGVERRFGARGALAVGAAAGAVLYHRATIATPDGLAATPGAVTAAIAGAAEARWTRRSAALHVGLELAVGIDVVAGAPELAVERGGTVESLGRVRAVQPRISLSLVAGVP